MPFESSSISLRPSPSSSGSALLPTPSPSVSNHSEGSNGKASGPASQMKTSLIVTDTGPSQYPSSSVSGSNEAVTGSDDASAVSFKPSLSSSKSSTSAGSDVEGPVRVSGMPSPSVSL